jgi:hypothetical protein
VLLRSVGYLLDEKYKIKKYKKINISKEELENNYIEKNMSRPELAKKYNIKKYQLDTLLRKYNIIKPTKLAIENTKKSMMNKYGVENSSQLDFVQKKKKENNIKKYGIEYGNLFHEIVRENNIIKYGKPEIMGEKKYQIKLKQGMLDKYGEKNPMNVPELKNKQKKSMLNKYGINHSSQRNINNFKIWKDDDKLKKFFTKNKNKYSYHDLMDFFNVSHSTAHEKMHKLGWDLFKHESESYFENQIENWLNENNVSYQKHNRQIIYPKELDFYIPSKNIAIEFNDTWSHNSTNVGGLNKGPKSQYYHFNKTKLCNSKGIQLIHLYEKDLDCLDDILHLLLPVEKYNARNCVYEHGVSVKDFIIENHRQHTCLKNNGGALFWNGMMVGAITFVKNRLDKLCFKKGIVINGGFGKLLKNYLKYEPMEEIVTYCDLDSNNGLSYEKLGFKVTNWNRNYYWVKGNEWLHRRDCQKSRIMKMFDLTKYYINTHTEKELMLEQGYVQIFTAGINTLELKL